jgi:hypothetical protein
MAMTLMDMLSSVAGGQMQQAGSAHGLNAQQSQQAIGALLPAISSAMKQNASTPQGLAGLLGALQNGGHDRYLNDAQALQSNAQTDGNAILGHLFGSKDVSRAVAGRAAQQTGIDSSILKKMLPMVAMMAMGAMGKQAQGNSGLQGMLQGALMQQLMGGGGAARGGLGGMLGGLLGGGARAQQRQQQQAHQGGLGMLAGMLDADGDGNAFDDLLGMMANRR